MNTMQTDNEKIKRLLQNNETLQSKIDKIEELIDKKIAKLKKDLDIANLAKQLKSKADDENVGKGFENTDKKITALSENLFALKKELDQALSSLEKLTVQTFSSTYDNASLSTKKINPLACLSCGNMSRNANPVHTAMGTDGKLYRADHSHQEGFEVGASSDLRSVLNKSLVPRDEKARGVNITYTYVQGTTSQTQIRPQTAGGRGKFFKNTITSSPVQTVQSESTYLLRPGSAKK